MTGNNSPDNRKPSVKMPGDNSMQVKVFAHGPRDLGYISGQVLPKNQKWYLIPPCLIFSIIRYVSRVKWSNPGKREKSPPLRHGVVAIENGTFL